MDQFDAYLRKLADQEPFPVPEDYHGKVFAALSALEETKQRRPRRRAWMGWVAAMLALVVALPNLSPSAAAAMGEIPVLGAIVEIFTFRSYSFDDGHSSVDVEIPGLGGSPAAEEVSQDVEYYTEQIMTQFRADCETLGTGYQGLTVTPQVVTDSVDWFTLRIDVVETRASSYEYSSFYHIDKKTGNIMTLGDLFDEEADYQTVLADEVRRQMEDRVDQGYFPESLESIEPDQNFYWDDQGGLVLVFDEYKIAAGAAGMPEFVIDRSAWEPLLKA